MTDYTRVLGTVISHRLSLSRLDSEGQIWPPVIERLLASQTTRFLLAVLGFWCDSAATVEIDDLDGMNSIVYIQHI